MPRKKINLQVKLEDVFYRNPKSGMMYLGKEIMSENEIKNLQEEIKFIEKSKWWAICQETLRQTAIEKSIYYSTSFDDMRNGKEILEVLNLLGKINMYIKGWAPKMIQKPPLTKPIEY